MAKKKIEKMINEYLRVKKLKEEYARYEKQYREELLKYEDYINKKDFPIQVTTVETTLINPVTVWKTIRKVPLFLKLVKIDKTALKKELDKKVVAEIISKSEIKTSKKIVLRKKEE